MLKKELFSKEQVFRYEYDGKTIFIAIDRLIRRLMNTPKIDIEVESTIAKKLIKDRSIDEKYVHKYMQDFKRIANGENVSILPCLVIWFKDNTWVLADGNNKYVAAYMSGIKTLKALEAKRQQWAPFIIRDFDERIPHGETILL